MNTCYLTLGGLSVALQTPFPLIVSPRLQSFVSYQAQPADCTVTVQLCQQLPVTPERPFSCPVLQVWQEETCLFFYKTAEKAQPYALTQFSPDGSVTLFLLESAASFLQNAAGLLSHMNMEFLLLQRNCLLLHASLICDRGKAICFAGASGTGKSTQAALWQQAGAQILNGDRALLRKTPDGWIAAGSPYAGTSGIYVNRHAPLQAVVLPEKAAQNRLTKLTAAEAFRRLYPEISIMRRCSKSVQRASALLSEFTAQTPIYRLECLPNEQAVTLLKEGIFL